jgi:hypothetical protein
MGLVAAFILLVAGCGGGGGTANPDGGGSGKDGAVTLPSGELHVVPDSDNTTATGSLEHPFASLFDAVPAIIADTSWTGALVVHEGRHEVATDINIPSRAHLKILPGAKIYLGNKASIHAQSDMDIQGTETNPVLFTWLVENTHWGALSNFEATSQNNIVKYAIFEHGGETEFKGSSMRGALSIKQAGGTFSHNVFRLNEGDDGLNIRASNSVIEYNDFVDNFNDALDSDTAAPNDGFVEVRFNKFHDNGNDGVDLGEGSTAYVHDNVMWGNGDKGVSVGETSFPRIEHNLIVGNATGMGLKDMSVPVIKFNTLVANGIGVAVYEGSPGRGSGKGTFSNGIIWGSVAADLVIANANADMSQTTFSYSCIQSGAYADSLTEGAVVKPLVGQGILTAANGCADPGFAAPGVIPPPVPMVGTSFTVGDFHLKSPAGRYDPTTKAHVTTDTTASPCIDKADPADSFALEPAPNGGRADLGTYGNSPEASKSAP